jgi:hypothetical protein
VLSAWHTVMLRTAARAREGRPAWCAQRGQRRERYSDRRLGG